MANVAAQYKRVILVVNERCIRHARHFNLLVAENHMKWSFIHPALDRYATGTESIDELHDLKDALCPSLSEPE